MRLEFEGTLPEILADIKTLHDRLNAAGYYQAAAPPPMVPATNGHPVPPVQPGPGQVWPPDPPAPAVPATARTANPACPVHLTEMVYHQAGTNKAGKAFSASWRCPVAGCRGQSIWLD